jgi:uncharacterized membrane-anchored protein YhcB (DUF1043 family)
MRPRGVLRLAAATALVVTIVIGMYAVALRQREQRLESMRAERQRIESELQRVKAMADESEPVVVLENGDAQLIVNRQDPHRKPQLFYY